MKIVIMLTALILVAMTISAPMAECATIQPRIKAVEIRVDNMEAAVKFYCGSLQFVQSGRVTSQDEVSLAHQGAEILLKRVSKRASNNFDTGAHVNLNLMVADVEGFAEGARNSGIQVLDSVPQQAQIGIYYRVLDPAGNMLHIIQPNFDFGDLAKPTVFNLGIQVVDMKQAREFYFDKLGFSALTEKYYPPVVPMKSSGIDLILHEGCTEPANERSTDETGISIVVELSEFDNVTQKLKPNTAKSRPGNSELPVYDPDGNLIALTKSR